MFTIKVAAHVDENHRLTADLPSDVKSGPVEVLVFVPATNEDDAGQEWMAGVAREWEAELSDPREDIYDQSDGAPIDQAR